MQVTTRNTIARTGEDSPLTDWVIAWTGCDGLWGGGKGYDIRFDDSCGSDWFRGDPGAHFGDWLVLGEDGIFFFVEKSLFETLFEVEREDKICPKCRYIPQEHVGPGTPVRSSAITHTSDCPTVSWMVPSEPMECRGGFRDDREWRHPDLIG